MRSVKTIVAAALAVCTIEAAAQAFPAKPVHIIVPFTPGSATDISARAVQQKLTEFWGQPVIVENRPGAGGTIGAAQVARAAPDGYSLLVHSSGHAANPFIYAKLPYDTAKDFADVTPVAGQATVLVVAPSTGFKTLAELLAASKAKPGTINFASAGSGSGTHLNACNRVRCSPEGVSDNNGPCQCCCHGECKPVEKRCGTCRWIRPDRSGYYTTYTCAFPMVLPSAYLNKHHEECATLTDSIHHYGPSTTEDRGRGCPTWQRKEE